MVLAGLVHPAAVEAANDVVYRHQAIETPVLADREAGNAVVAQNALRVAHRRVARNGYDLPLHHVAHLEALQELHDDFAGVAAQGLGVKRGAGEDFVVVRLLALEYNGGVFAHVRRPRASAALFREKGLVKLHAGVVLRKRARDEGNREVVRDLDHRLGKRLCVVDDDAHRADDVRRADRLVARKRG